MRRLLLYLLLALPLCAQIITINPNDPVSSGPAILNSNFSYLDTFKAGLNRANVYGAYLQNLSAAMFIAPLKTVATLPSAAASTNFYFIVTDGSVSNDCTVGGGSLRVPCVSNGAAWVPIGGSGTLTSFSGSGPSWLTWTVATPTTTPAVTLAPTTGQTSHRVIGTCGTATTYTPCALVAGDLPNTAVTPSTYGDGTHVGQFTVDQQGRITSASSIAITANGSMFSGSTAIGTACGGSNAGITGTAAAPVISLADQSVKSPHLICMPTLTTNVTSVTINNTTNGADIYIDWPQSSSGGPFTVSGYVNISTTKTACAVTPNQATPSYHTIQHFIVEADGVTLDGEGCPSTDPADAGVTSFNTRYGAITLLASDIPNVNSLISTSGAVTDPGNASDYQFNNASGALTFNAPVGVAGLQRCYRNATGKSGVITIQMAASNTVDLNGVNSSSAGTLVSTGALGDAACIVSDAANHWYAYVQKGSWSTT